jgi:integrase
MRSRKECPRDAETSGGVTPETEVPVQNDSSTRRRERVAPGIYVRDGVYSAGFNDPNTGRWTMANLEATALGAAKKERASLLAALREGRAASKSMLDFDTCLDRYLQALDSGTTREKTVRHNRWVAKRYLRDQLGTKPVQEITTSDVRKVLRSVRHLSGWTQAKVVQVMREGFAVAIREDALVRSPLEKLDPRELPRPTSTKKPRRLDKAELERLLAAAKTKTPGYYPLFVLLAFTGLRIREALALTWRDIDLEHDVVRVERQLADDDRRHLEVKTENAVRELPLYPVLRRVLVQHKLASLWNGETDPIFAAGRGKAKGYRNVLRAFGEAVAEAQIAVEPNERLSPHSLRHTYTSHLIVGLELDAATASKLAGHANPQVTMRVYADDFRKASERNAAVLARAAERGFGT